MREAILSDIHGNLEALRAVEGALRSLAADEVRFVGDAVGYGPDPNPCAEWVGERASVAVAGNHDFAAVGAADAGNFNPLARQALEWTARELTPATSAWLAGLPLQAEADGATFVHANPRLPSEWGYITTVWDADVNFGYFAGPLCFVGHSHQPVMVRRAPDGEVTVVPGDTLLLEPGCRYLVNVGSVGQPRDRNPAACFGLLDRGRGEFTLVRVPYDLALTQEKMRRAGLPEPLAARLAAGR